MSLSINVVYLSAKTMVNTMLVVLVTKFLQPCSNIIVFLHVTRCGCAKSTAHRRTETMYMGDEINDLKYVLQKPRCQNTVCGDSNRVTLIRQTLMFFSKLTDCSSHDQQHIHAKSVCWNYNDWRWNTWLPLRYRPQMYERPIRPQNPIRPLNILSNLSNLLRPRFLPPGFLSSIFDWFSFMQCIQLWNWCVYIRYFNISPALYWVCIVLRLR